MTSMPTRRFGVPVERDWEALADEDFRAAIRSVFDEYPDELRFPARRLLWAEQSDWYLTMARRGLIAPGWETEWGGMGLGPVKLRIFLEEQERAGIARYQDHGVRMVGPAVIRFGTEEQQRLFLPPILAGEHRYSQGFSEPDAGSDLAALSTTAEPSGDGFVISGRKIWTTMAYDATHLFVLARTGPAGGRSAMGFFLMDLTSPGVQVRRIRDIAGHEELCEVVMDRVAVPAVNLIGPLGAGWAVAMDILGSERIHVGGPGLVQHGLGVLRQMADARERNDDPVIVAQIADLELAVQNLSDLYERYVAAMSRGETLGHEVSVLKIWATETFQRIGDTIIDLSGAEGGSNHAGALDIYYKALPSTIYGGTNEIQRNTLARHVLALGRPVVATSNR